MPPMLKQAAEWCAVAIEVTGIAIITLVAAAALIYAVITSLRGTPIHQAVQRLRQQLGRGILVGLEFLVAADIVHTVVVDLSLHSITVLAIVVLIRTFLSFTLEVELSGKWPWQRAHASNTPPSASPDQ